MVSGARHQHHEHDSSKPQRQPLAMVAGLLHFLLDAIRQERNCSAHRTQHVRLRPHSLQRKLRSRKAKEKARLSAAIAVKSVADDCKLSWHVRREFKLCCFANMRAMLGLQTNRRFTVIAVMSACLLFSHAVIRLTLRVVSL